MKRFFTIAFAAIALAMLLVSCNKDNKKNLGLGFWEVESEDAEKAGSSSLFHAWYYYSEEDGGYDICFSDNDDFENRLNSNWALVDLHKSFCGEEHSLTENLDMDSGIWNFYGGTKTYTRFDDRIFTEGTIFLDVNMENNSIVFRLNGTTISGAKIKIEYVGSAKRMDNLVDPRVYPVGNLLAFGGLLLGLHPRSDYPSNLYR